MDIYWITFKQAAMYLEYADIKYLVVKMTAIEWYI